MRRFVALPLVAALAACATVEQRDASEPRLVGTWLLMEPDVEFPLACASDVPVRYDADGRYHLFEESGTWRLDGDRLTETATEILESGDPETAELGRPFVSRIEWLGADAFRKFPQGAEAANFRRCPPSR
ncbi:hypothetical protein [Sphingosinicella sp. CPCC 101087]|uniref:hypothetical protein n=1 Tax=Sphingosinicella sp. CPCC 101087 TaxID=2497754 RepID=UPI00101DFAB5|nr:hypothetical protein [Sphingosinicella sp. CPCC 101087]